MQRDAPDAVRGRSFARFETRFQLIWVVGGLLGLVPIAGTLGLLALAVALGSGGISYLLGMRAAGERVARRRQRAERTRAAVLGGLREGVARVRRRLDRRAPPPRSAPKPVAKPAPKRRPPARRPRAPAPSPGEPPDAFPKPGG